MENEVEKHASKEYYLAKQTERFKYIHPRKNVLTQ